MDNNNQIKILVATFIPGLYQVRKFYKKLDTVLNYSNYITVCMICLANRNPPFQEILLGKF